MRTETEEQIFRLLEAKGKKTIPIVKDPKRKITAAERKESEKILAKYKDKAQYKGFVLKNFA
jgi:hypothetical protein